MAEWGISSGGSYEPAPTGAHTGICTQVIDLGTQTSEYNGETLERRQFLFTWELPDELREDEQPFTISKFYTLSKDKKSGALYINEKSNLFKDLTSWLGRQPQAPFSPQDLLGKGCQVIVTEKNEKHVVSAVASLKKNEKVGEPHNDLLYFSLDSYDEDVFENISQGIKKIIMKSPEYAKIVSGDEPEDETIPF
jgi:hypothetical protein